MVTDRNAQQIVLKWSMPCPVADFDMPGDAVVIEVSTQNGVPTIWTLSSPDAPRRLRTFVGYGTGHPIDEDGLIYVGTAHNVEDSRLVFHLFERTT